ncbi:MAG: FmdB family zinc ribbon protein [Streptosporangiaceae bacterium]
MPTYEYACTSCGEQLEAVQRFSDDPLTVCPACGGALRKVFSPVGIVFKGSGFYRTDSRNGAIAGAGKDGGDKANGDKPGSDKTGADKDRATTKANGSGESSSSDTKGSSDSSSSSSDSKKPADKKPAKAGSTGSSS